MKRTLSFGQILLAVALICCSFAKVTRAEGVSVPAPIVIELFTAQGCRSCPEADAYLTELGSEPDLLILSYHLDHWDYVGWPDPFALEAAKQRQKGYGETFGLRYVYTPQMVIQGREQVAGSMRDEVEQAIALARSRGPALRPLAVTIRDNPVRGDLAINVGPAVGLEGALLDSAAEVQVWAIRYHLRTETQITAGENAGMSVVNSHVVRGLEKLGPTDGPQITYYVNRPEPQEGLAVLVQARPTGPILGAASITLKELNDAETAQR
ncbi:MAG: DUF1223 domain-containing protein [Magnetovibrionaceae bacterium]